MKENYDRVETVPQGRKEAAKAHAKEPGESVNAFINRAVAAQIELDKEGEA